ncbi:MAG: ECF-type sigma factor [Pseudomonadota bacterium]
MSQHGDITQLLNRWGAGDQRAGDELTPLIYDELQRLARRVFGGEKPSHTLQPTALVHEAFEKLVSADVDWKDRSHFYSLAARMMRRLLVNHANARNAAKRGGYALRVTFAEDQLPDGNADTDMLDLEEALTALGELDKRKAELIELQYFGGLSFAEMEQVTGLSSSTLDRDLRLARAWLKDYLSKK